MATGRQGPHGVETTVTTAPATVRVAAAYERLRAAGRPEVWVTLRPEAEARAAASAVDARVAAGERLPLAGTVVAVKDNIDVAGFPTTAACPAYAYRPTSTAPAVQRLVDAGAVVLGKANLDQFATGLVGTRSPYGAVRGVPDPERIAGGSSSGSAVAVALGIVDIGVGTDTAGSGRVPAALTGIVGIKATRGLVPTTGVVPASRPHDCVTVLARTLPEAAAALRAMAGPEPADPLSRSWPADVRLAALPSPRVAVPTDDGLAPLSAGRRALFDAAADRLAQAGAEVVAIDIAPFLAAARLLYDSALVAERHAAVGAFVEAHPGEVDPVVGPIIAAAGRHPATALAAAQAELDRLRVAAEAALAGYHALLLPTAPTHPTLAEVAADPVGVNRHLGTYTNFLNLLDMAGVAVPAGVVEGAGAFGVTVAVRAFDDQVATDIAALLAGEAPPVVVDGGCELVVFGAHLRGQPLNHQLTALGARFVDDVATTDAYRMYALPTAPPKPAVVAVGAGRGGPLQGERWRLSPAALGTFLAALPAPLALGRVTLADGTTPTGFLAPASAAAGAGAPDITPLGGWLAHLDRAARP
jgi:allophanate hydrolase